MAGMGVGLLIAAFERHGYSYGGPNTPILNRDPRRLLPSFADKLEILFERMRKRGFDPFLNEGYRTSARTTTLAAQGKGVVDSLHSYGAAADVISEEWLWGNLAFFKALGEETDELGLTWGGKWKGDDYDPSHIQAIPVFLQDEFRNLETMGSREAFLKDVYTA